MHLILTYRYLLADGGGSSDTLIAFRLQSGVELQDLVLRSPARRLRFSQRAWTAVDRHAQRTSGRHHTQDALHAQLSTLLPGTIPTL